MEGFVNQPTRIRDLIKKRPEVPFYKELDMLTCCDNVLVGVSGKMTMGLKLKGIPFYLKDNKEKAVVISLAKKLLNELPEKTFYQFIIQQRIGDKKTLQEFYKTVNPRHSFDKKLICAEIQSLKKSLVCRKELYLFITTEDPRVSQSNLNGLKKLFHVGRDYWRTVKENEHILRKEELEAKAQSVVNSLKTLGIVTERLTGEDLETFIYEELNPTRKWVLPAGGNIPDVPQEHSESVFGREATLRSRVVFSAPKSEFEYFYLDGYFHQIVNLLVPPESTDIRAMEELTRRLNFGYSLSLGIYVPDQQKAMERLNLKANLSKSFSLISTSKNYDSEEKYHELDALLTELKASTQKLFEVSLSIMVKKKDLENVKKRSNAALQAFHRFNNSEAVIDHLNHDRLFLSFLPGHGSLNHRKHIIQTNALAQILPVDKEWQGTEKPYLLLKTDHNALLKLDPFDHSLPAKHGLVFGTTGSGKSFFTNYLLAHFLAASPEHSVVIIDVGGSYRRLSEVFKGSYLEIDLSGRYRLNPFPPKENFFVKGAIDHDQLGFLTLLLEKMIKEKSFSPRDVRILEQSIEDTYKRIANDKAPLLSDVVLTLTQYAHGDAEDKKRAVWFAKNLELWAKGRFGTLLNQYGNVEVENRLCVFDLQRLREHPDLQSLVFFMIRSSIAKKLYDISLKKIIVIDEGWRFFQDEVGSELIQDLYRTARKFNAMVLSISQSPQDFLSAMAAPAIITNSYTKYIFKLNKGHELLSQFDLNDSEINAVTNLATSKGEYAQLFIKFHTNSVVAKLEPTTLDYWLATSDPDDLRIEKEYRKKYQELNDYAILEKLAADYPKGVQKRSPR